MVVAVAVAAVDPPADSAFRIHLLTTEDAAEMIDEVRGARLLRGYRGAPPADEAALRDVVLRVSALLSVCQEIQELDLNPVKVLASGACAVDARVRVERLVPTRRDVALNTDRNASFQPGKLHPVSCRCGTQRRDGH